MNCIITKLLCLLIPFLLANSLFAHDGKKHDPAKAKKKENKEIVQDSLVKIHQEDGHQEDGHHEHGQHQHEAQEKELTASLSDFPTLHPLIVHFPIVLLIFATLFQLLSFFMFKEEFSWAVLIMLFIGFATAYLAKTVMHPHTHDISQHAKEVLAQHDLYADLTVWLGGISLLLKGVGQILLKKKIYLEIAVVVLLISASTCVSLTGHYGAQLVHIEGIGPQGKYLETQGHHH